MSGLSRLWLVLQMVVHSELVATYKVSSGVIFVLLAAGPLELMLGVGTDVLFEVVLFRTIRRALKRLACADNSQ